MLEFQCPSCQAKCAVEDSFRGHKLKCPKCKTRIRHHLDGTIELLSLGDPATAPTQPASAVAPPAPALGPVEVPTAPLPEPASAPPPPFDAAGSTPLTTSQGRPATGMVTKFSRRSESTQNWILLAVIGAVVVAVIVALGALLKNWLVAAGGLAVAFAVAYAVLFLRSRRRDRMAAAVQAAVAAKADEKK